MRCTLPTAPLPAFVLLFLALCITGVPASPAWGQATPPASKGPATQGDVAPIFFTPPPMSLETFRFRCIMESDRGGGSRLESLCGPGDQADICDSFEAVLSEVQPVEPLCLNACRRIRGNLSPANVFNGCERILRNAWRTCNRYCRINYPQ